MFTQTYSKYRAKRTEYNGYQYDSKFEAGVAYTLDLKLRAGLILGWERQYKIECIPYNVHGDPVPECSVSHKVDFRVKNLDESYTLLEAKGVETPDYRTRRKWLEKFWLPAHPDHTYEVVKDGKKGWRSFA